MATKAMWEVDPETRSKLQAIQRSPTATNDKCADCSAPSPQWASPKFGVFICLSCAGVHRGLGVHISFVRSITMDAFKAAEIERMRLGGNKEWKDFFDQYEANVLNGVGFDDATIAERYSSDAGEEYKERLTAKVESRPYVAVPKAPASNTTAKPAVLTASTNGSRSHTPISRTDSPASATGGKFRVDEKYFASLGTANASRSEDLPPSQGGKYQGFGSTPVAPRRDNAALPGFDDLQRDPVQAISRGLGWFGGMVGKTAKNVQDGYIAPAARTIAESDVAAQARMTALSLGQTAQTGARSAAEGFNRFVEGNDGRTARTVPIDESKKDFWDSFSEIGDKKAASGAGSGNIGTGSVKRAPGSGAGKKDEDGWGDW